MLRRLLFALFSFCIMNNGLQPDKAFGAADERAIERKRMVDTRTAASSMP